MSKVLCFYHSADMDGKCSGSIVKSKYSDSILYGVDYKDNIDLNTYNIQSDDIVFIVDFSFNPELMIELNSMCNLIWIDHHISAIERSIENKYSDIKGIRDVKKAGCELTWEYIYNNIPIPKSVTLMGRYDVWDHDRMPNILEFQYGLKIHNTSVKNIILWNKLLNNDNELFINKIIEQGNSIITYEDTLLSTVFKYKTWTRTFRNYRCLISNSKFINFGKTYYDFINKNKIQKHDVMITINYDGNIKKWMISLRTDNENIDIRSIAEEYGGGGHQKACGFDCKELIEELF